MSTIIKGNSEFDRKKFEDVLYPSIDFVGTMRQGGIIASAISTLRGIGSLARAFSSVTPITQLITGPLCAIVSVAYFIPNTIADVKITAAAADDTGIRLAILSLINAVFAGVMGIATTACGIVEFLGPKMAHLFHYLPILAKPVATFASTAVGSALGAIYVIRGSIMVTRASYQLKRAFEFKNAFLKELKLISEINTFDTLNRHVDDILDFKTDLQKTYENSDEIGPTNKQKKTRGRLALSRKIGIIEKETLKDAEGKEVIINGKSIEIPVTKEHSTLEEKIDYIAKIDKGNFSIRLQQTLSLIIGISMIIGGALLIASLFVFPPLAILIISLVCAVFFIAVEGIFLPYDSSTLLKKLTDWLYGKGSQELQELRKAYETIQNDFGGKNFLQASKEEADKRRQKLIDNISDLSIFASDSDEQKQISKAIRAYLTGVSNFEDLKKLANELYFKQRIQIDINTTPEDQEVDESNEIYD